MYTNIYIYIYMINTRIYICICIYQHTHIYIYKYIDIYTCIYVYANIYVYGGDTVPEVGNEEGEGHGDAEPHHHHRHLVFRVWYLGVWCLVGFGVLGLEFGVSDLEMGFWVFGL